MPEDSGKTLELLAEARQLLDLAPTAEISEAAVAFAKSIVTGEKEEARARCARILDLVEGRVFDLSRSSTHPEPEDLQKLSQSLVVLDAVRDFALPALDESPPDTILEVKHEMVGLAPILSDAEAPALLGLGARMDRLSVDRIDALSAHTLRPEDPGRFLHVLGATEVDLYLRGQAHVLDRVRTARESYWRIVVATLEPKASAERAPLYQRLADGVNDRAEDVLAQVEELPHSAAIFVLRATIEDVERLQEIGKQLELKLRRRELRLAKLRLLGAIDAREITDGQRHRFGKRGQRILDWAIFTIILGLLGILARQTLGSPSDAEERVLIWVDFGLCMLLFSEFAWRWSMTRFSLRYLRRSFLIDVLPSIPFGLLLHSDVLSVLRVGRLVQTLRLLRPILQAYRLLAFALQGLDRLVRRHAYILNRNIVLFDEPEEEEGGSLSPTRRLRHLHDRGLRTFKQGLSKLSSVDKSRVATTRLSALTHRLDLAPGCDLNLDVPRLGRFRDIRIEGFIEELTSVDSHHLDDRLGEEGSLRLVRFLRLLDVPILRSFPILRQVVPGVSRLDPHQALIRAGRNLGRTLDSWLDRIRFFADLQGIVTGSQLLDRVGGALVKATQRPAVRLLIFGFIAMVVAVIMELFPQRGGFIEKVQGFIGSVLGKGLLFLGGACLLIQGFGRWIRHLAGEATDLYEKVAEAHGIDLLKFDKLNSRVHDLGVLFDRVVLPESCVLAPESLSEERDRFVSYIPSLSPGPIQASPIDHALTTARFYYLDYLDAGILHRSNVKTTEQFLGNLQIEGIRSRRLRHSKKEVARLKKLDLARDRAIPTGPYLWFLFITESLAQKTAKLVLEYNRRAVPLSVRDRIAPETVRAFESWLKGRHGTRAEGLRIAASDDHAFASAPFNALHFLNVDKHRDARVAAEFGPEVLDRLIFDRRNVVRAVFSSYPYEALPRHRRTFNPYTLYQRYFARGRVLLLPFRLIIFWILGFFRGVKIFFRIVREQINPYEFRTDWQSTHAEFESAVRKINRMHRPLFMALLDLRARFDPEYLGTRLPGRATLALQHGIAVEDLELIGARQHEREEKRSRKEEVDADVAALEKLLNAAGWPDHSLLAALGCNRGNASPPEEIESLRAITVAFVVDFQNVKTLAVAHQELSATFHGLLQGGKTHRRRRRRLRKALENSFRVWLAQSPFSQSTLEEQAIFRAAIAANQNRAKQLITLLGECGSEARALGKSREILAQVAAHPRPWTDQLITLRSVQALACLDLQNTRRIVATLGAFDENRSPSTPTA